MNFNQYVKDNALNLRGLTNINIENLVSFLQNNPNITYLDLSGSNISNKDVKALAESQALKNLKYINLSNNNIVVLHSDHGQDWVSMYDRYITAYHGIEALANSRNLKKLESLDLSRCSIGRKGIGILAQSSSLRNLGELNLCNNHIDLSAMVDLTQLELGKLHLDCEHKDFYDFLAAKNLDTEYVKKMIFRMAPHDNNGKAIIHVLEHYDKYGFLINSQDEEGHALSYFYNQNPWISKSLFQHGLIPSGEQERGTELHGIVQGNQSVHASPVVKQTNFITRELVESIGADKAQLKQAADSYAADILKLLNLYQSDQVRRGLLNITEQEKRSVMEKTPTLYSPDDKIFITNVAKKAIKALREQYLRKGQDGKYDEGYPTALLQYDYKRDDAKVTIPESIGYVKLLIDRLSIPLKERKELLVTLVEQNPKLVKEKLPQIRLELGNDDIYLEQITDRTEFHKLLEKVTDPEKTDKSFKEISGLDIEEVWREQKEFILMKQIYVAKTTYGENSSACIQGVWSQIINSVSEIDLKLMDQYEKHLHKENGQEKQKDSITEGNIIQFLENLAEKLIQYVEDNQELKEALSEFAVADVDVEKPEDITLEQQKILAKINQEFSKSIKKYLPSYDRSIPKIDEYKIIIAELSGIGVMQNFAQKLAQSQMPTHAGDAESEEFQQEFLVEEVFTGPEIEQPQPGLIVKEVNQAEEIQLEPEIKQPQQVPVVEEVQPEPGVKPSQEHTEEEVQLEPVVEQSQPGLMEEGLHNEQDPHYTVIHEFDSKPDEETDIQSLTEDDEQPQTEATTKPTMPSGNNQNEAQSKPPQQNHNLPPTDQPSTIPNQSPQQTSTKKRFMYGMMIASPFLAVGIYSGLAGAVAFNPILATGIFIGVAVAALASFVIMKASEEKEKDPDMNTWTAVKTVLKNIFTFQCERDDGIKV